MTANDIINIIESVAPLSSQEGWDNSGLQIGSRETVVSRCLLCTDITLAAVEEAIEKGCEMVLSHHPLLFHGLKTIQGLTERERVVMRAVREGLVIYSSHTPMDKYLHGVSGRMAERLGIKEYDYLSPDCLGVVGNLPKAVSIGELMKSVKAAFACRVIRYSLPVLGMGEVQRVALCGGAGAEYMEAAKQMGADVFISADFKYHDFQAARDIIAVMDIGHFESEQYTKEVFAELLAGTVECVMAETDRSLVEVEV